MISVQTQCREAYGMKCLSIQQPWAWAICAGVKTVENHRTNITNKLELRGSHALLKFALEHKSELP